MADRVAENEVAVPNAWRVSAEIDSPHLYD